jgi:hypothetical protein
MNVNIYQVRFCRKMYLWSITGLLVAHIMHELGIPFRNPKASALVVYTFEHDYRCLRCVIV